MIIIKRVIATANEIMGVMHDDHGNPICLTLENAWRDNKRYISAIPEGEYKLTRHNSPKFKECFLLHNVPNRLHILIHAGNTHKNTKGCILVGMSFGKIQGINAVMNSSSVMDKLLKELPDETMIKIVDCYK